MRLLIEFSVSFSLSLSLSLSLSVSIGGSSRNMREFANIAKLRYLLRSFCFLFLYLLLHRILLPPRFSRTRLYRRGITGCGTVLKNFRVFTKRIASRTQPHITRLEDGERNRAGRKKGWSIGTREEQGEEHLVQLSVRAVVALFLSFLCSLKSSLQSSAETMYKHASALTRILYSATTRSNVINIASLKIVLRG